MTSPNPLSTQTTASPIIGQAAKAELAEAPGKVPSRAAAGGGLGKAPNGRQTLGRDSGSTWMRDDGGIHFKQRRRGERSGSKSDTNCSPTKCLRLRSSAFCFKR